MEISLCRWFWNLPTFYKNCSMGKGLFSSQELTSTQMERGPVGGRCLWELCWRTGLSHFGQKQSLSGTIYCLQGKEVLLSAFVLALNLIMTLRKPPAGSDTQRGRDRFPHGSCYLHQPFTLLFGVCLATCPPVMALPCHLAWLLPRCVCLRPFPLPLCPWVSGGGLGMDAAVEQQGAGGRVLGILVLH